MGSLVEHCAFFLMGQRQVVPPVLLPAGISVLSAEGLFLAVGDGLDPACVDAG
jgi:hypothetical protein